jgi:DNA polymerase I-like protein with 3'-5' exonuclease and polymerase domains
LEGRAKLALIVHDELVYFVRHEHVDEVVPHIVHEMEKPIYELTVPLKVRAKVGPNYGDLVPWEGRRNERS